MVCRLFHLYMYTIMNKLSNYRDNTNIQYYIVYQIVKIMLMNKKVFTNVKDIYTIEKDKTIFVKYEFIMPNASSL